MGIRSEIWVKEMVENFEDEGNILSIDYYYINKVFREATARESIPQGSSSWGKTLYVEWYSSLSNTDEMTVIPLRESGMTSQPVKSMYKLRM